MTDKSQDADRPPGSGGAAGGEAPLVGFRAALVLGFAFLFAMAVTALSVAADAANRGRIETAVEETAVGDNEVQVIGGRRIDHETVEAVFQGVPLYFAHLKEVKIDDKHMRALGRDDAGRFTLYEPVDESLRHGHDGQKLYYIKRSPNKYAQLHDRPEEMLPPLTSPAPDPGE